MGYLNVLEGLLGESRRAEGTGYLDVLEVLLGESRRAGNRGEPRRGDDGLGYYTGEVMLLERERLLITYSDSAND